MQKGKVKILILTVLILSVIATSNLAVSAKTVRKNGYYYTITQKTYTSEYGENLYTRKVKIIGNRIITYGNFSYGKKQWGGRKIKAQKRTFIISPKCTYWDDWGVPTGMSRMKKRKLLSCVKSLSKMSDTGQCFIMKVKHGKVVKMMVGQG